MKYDHEYTAEHYTGGDSNMEQGCPYRGKGDPPQDCDYPVCGCELAAGDHDTTVVPADAASHDAGSLPNCVVLSRAWMEAYVRAQETFDTRELEAFGYGAADLLGQVVLAYESLYAQVGSGTASANAERAEATRRSASEKEHPHAVPSETTGRTLQLSGSEQQAIADRVMQQMAKRRGSSTRRDFEVVGLVLAALLAESAQETTR